MLLGLLLLLAGCGLPTGQRTIEVRAQTMETAELRSAIDLTGVLVPAQTVDLSSRLTGQVKTLNVEVGRAVKAGDILLTLETDALSAQLEQAQAGQASANAALELARSQVELSRIELEAAQKNLEAVKGLFAGGGVSRNQLDDATDRYQVARRRHLNASGPALGQARAAVGTSRASIHSLEVQIGGAILRSPISGVVTNLSARLGALVGPGAPLVSVADTSVLKLKGTVSQELLPVLSVGQVMDVTVDIYPGKVLPGRLTTLGPIAVSTGEVFPLEISVENSTGILAGVSAHATAQVKGRQGLVVPAGAVGQQDGKSYVFVIEKGVARRRVVVPGVRAENGLEIRSGLEVGEQVAVTNLAALADQVPVRVLP